MIIQLSDFFYNIVLIYFRWLILIIIVEYIDGILFKNIKICHDTADFTQIITTIYLN